jgi:hypothetical protein
LQEILTVVPDGKPCSTGGVYPREVARAARAYQRGVLVDDLQADFTVTVDALAGSDTDLLATTWVVATDLMQTFGIPEARAVTQDGAVRAGWMPSDCQQGLTEFAAGRGVALDDSQPAEAT